MERRVKCINKNRLLGRNPFRVEAVNVPTAFNVYEAVITSKK